MDSSNFIIKILSKNIILSMERKRNILSWFCFCALLNARPPLPWNLCLSWGRSLPVLHHSSVSGCVGIQSSPCPRPAGWLAWPLIALWLDCAWPWSLSLALTLTWDCCSSSWLLVSDLTGHTSQNTAPGSPAFVEQLTPSLTPFCVAI